MNKQHLLNMAMNSGMILQQSLEGFFVTQLLSGLTPSEIEELWQLWLWMVGNGNPIALRWFISLSHVSYDLSSSNLT